MGHFPLSSRDFFRNFFTNYAINRNEDGGRDFFRNFYGRNAINEEEGGKMGACIFRRRVPAE
jgi:hypothetical protein